jgi:phage-related minor tail protein
MSHTLRIRTALAAVVLMSSVRVAPLLAQSTASSSDRLAAAEKEIAALKTRATDQDRHIAELERTIRQLQAAVRAIEHPAPTSWKNLEGWTSLKIGMSRAQVVEILGDPKTTEAVMDRQTLRYEENKELVGSVVLVDDRVTEVSCDRFQVYAPERN